MKRGLAAIVLALASLPAAADAPVKSLRPPQLTTGPVVEPTVPAVAPEVSAAEPVAQGLARSPRPRARPDGLGTVTATTTARASTVPLTPQAKARANAAQADRNTASRRELKRKGAVCGDLDIVGEEVGTVSSASSACGIKDAVRVRSVAGVTLSQSALMNCPTAAALKSWVVRGVQPSFRKRDQVVQLQVAASYACRSRNNVKGARVSEHGKGNAIDISGFVLKSGKALSVLHDYSNNGPLGAARRAACGIFGTVLGPGSDRYHANHFHLDTARYRTGAYCR
ncbi:extensin family protein [Seohaeicola nanhaiensis]|uniref:Extensin family protein n=1 Tax=Seohaeicola nanhaiensis TaxID=1387282 RepID=A0ABV9KMS7_9RHOB